MKNKQNKYIVILISSFVLFFGMCGNLMNIITYGNITLNNTTEFTATVKDVLIQRSGDEEGIILITEEYGDKLRVFQYQRFSRTEDFMNIEEGEKISFRIQNDWLESFEEIPFINIVQLRTETREVFSFVNYANPTGADFNLAVVAAIFVCFAFLGVVVFCIYKLYTMSGYYKKKEKFDWNEYLGIPK